MSRYEDAFPDRRHVVLPVIHVEDEAQALRNARIARESGCDGVFLINHAQSYRELLPVQNAVVRAQPDWWVGVNCLDLSAEKVFAALPGSVAGVWVDNAGIDDAQEEQTRAEGIASARRGSGWAGLYFGGVDFKYQRQASDLTRAARLATRFMDVVTTSGPGTGEAASIDKIVTMKEAIGDHPLAIASGITPENVGDYLPHADCFLVATGISHGWSELDPARVTALVQAVRAPRT